MKTSENIFSEPIDHVLSRLGICSDRAFKNFIRLHQVKIRTEDLYIPVSDRNQKIDSDKSSLYIDEKEIVIPEHLYILLNKPVNYVCSRVSDSHKTVFSLFSAEILSNPAFSHLHVAGRLDSDSRGLVFLTTNGSLSNFFISPESHVKKEYRVKLEIPVSDSEQKIYVKNFARGLSLLPEKKGSGFITKPAELVFESPSEARVVISEGKFHQVRRMFGALKNRVTDLQRTRFGKLSLPFGLSEGEYVVLNRAELESIQISSFRIQDR